jgi:hypothetical protein
LRFEVLTAVTKNAATVTVSIFSENFISSKAHTYFSKLSDAKHISTDTSVILKGTNYKMGFLTSNDTLHGF